MYGKGSSWQQNVVEMLLEIVGSLVTGVPREKVINREIVRKQMQTEVIAKLDPKYIVEQDKEKNIHIILYPNSNSPTALILSKAEFRGLLTKLCMHALSEEPL